MVFEHCSPPRFHVVGGGLAGCEAAWQFLKAGYSVCLYEMRPNKSTAAHQTSNLAELVCSNSLKSTLEHSAPGLLKEEMLALNSLVIGTAYDARVPAGQALAVDRLVFSQKIYEKLLSFGEKFQLLRQEIPSLPSAEELSQKNEYWLIATGPLTSESLTRSIRARADIGEDNCYFYDAIAPVIEADSIDWEIAFKASRYEEGQVGDYANIPLTKEQYESFIDAVTAAEKMPLHDFEDPKYFESCLPIEVMIERGRETLRFGPMKPVGLTDPKTGRWPYAAIQLRQENIQGTMYSMVGFQTKMKWPEQKRVFSQIPGLHNAEFFRFGSVHRNTYMNSPKILNADFSLKASPRIFLAGQITGVEGYTESASIGLMAARCAIAKAQGKILALPPKSTMIGALSAYVLEGGLGEFQPMNTNMGLLPPLESLNKSSKKMPKNVKKEQQCARARDDFKNYYDTVLAPHG